MGREPKGELPHRHLLYTAAVQSLDADLDFFEKVYRKARGAKLTTLREDFCGTAALSCAWVKRRADNRAIGIDLDRPTLDWGRERYVSTLGDAADRLELIEGDVLDVTEPRPQLVAALNFSYSVFKERESLGAYFSAVRRSLGDDGVFVIDAFGGTEALEEDVEERKIPAERAFDGTKLPRFTYVWEQARFNPIDHSLTCHIHFKVGRGKQKRKIKKAFTYDWRLWMLPELCELMRAAGFSAADVYVEGWDDDDEPDGKFRRKRDFENQAGWVAYVVGTV